MISTSMLFLIDCQDEKAALELIAHARNTSPNQTIVAIAIVSARNEVRDIFAKGAKLHPLQTDFARASRPQHAMQPAV